MNKERQNTIKSAFKESFSFDIGAFLFALISTVLFMLSTCIYIGITVFNLNGPNIYSWIEGVYLILVAGCAVFIFAFLYLLASFIYSLIRKSLSKSTQKPEPLSIKETAKKYFLPLFVILLICWLPWIIAHYPGSLDQDTIWQTLIWRTSSEWYDHHPWLTTALFGSVLDFGSVLGSQGIALFLFTTIQAVLYSLLLSLTFCYVLRFSVPKPVWIAFFVLACILPAYPSFASQMVKDSFFVLFWIPFLLFFFEGLRTRGECFKGLLPLVLFIASIILVVLSNKKGIYLALPASFVLLLYVKSDFRIKCTAVLVIPLVTSLVWSNILLPAWNVDKGPSKELYSLPLQQTANYVSQYPNDVSQEEQEIINKVLPYESLPDIYTLTSADSVKDTFKDPNSSDVLVYLSTWTNMGFRHPDSYLVSVIGTNYNLFTPVVPFQLRENLDQAWVDEQVSFFSQFLSNDLASEEIQSRDAQTREGIAESTALSPVRSVLYTYEKIINYTPLRIVNSPSFFAFYLPLLLLCFALNKTPGVSKTRLLLALIPSLLILASIIVGPLVLSRYCITGLFAAILIASLPWIMKTNSSDSSHDD